MSRKMLLAVGTVAAWCALGIANAGPISLADGVAHRENFDTLLTTGATGGGDPGSIPINAEVVNATFWTGTAGDPVSTGWWNGSGVNFGSASDGSAAANSNRLVSYGESGVTERAIGLGWRPLDGVNVSVGAQFQNSTGAAVSQLDISFDGELWYTGPQAQIGAPNTLTFEYSTDATTILDSAATWIAVTALNFTAPSADRTQFTTYDGNLDENRMPGISNSITGLNIPADSTFFIRWSNSASHAAGIDNFSITAFSDGAPPIADPVITDIAFDGTDVTLTWDSSPGRLYLVEASTDLNPASWANYLLADELVSGGTSTTFVWPDGDADPVVDPAAESSLFFRVTDIGAAP